MIIYKTIHIPTRGEKQHYIQVQESFWSCTHVNTCSKYTLYINLHILLIIVLKIQESRKSNKYIKSYK